jgi:hypothetical protein
MTKIKSIKQNLLIGQPMKTHQVMAQNEAISRQVKGNERPEPDDEEEEDHIWTAKDSDLKGIKSVITSLTDPNFDWSKSSSDGKQSHKNFNEWLCGVMDKLHSDRKKLDDQDIFN